MIRRYASLAAPDRCATFVLDGNRYRCACGYVGRDRRRLGAHWRLEALLDTGRDVNHVTARRMGGAS